MGQLPKEGMLSLFGDPDRLHFLGRNQSALRQGFVPKRLDAALAAMDVLPHQKRAAPFVRDGPMKDGNFPLF